jgi:hypothetical protein
MTTTQNIPEETDRLFLLAIEAGDRAAKAESEGRMKAAKFWTEWSDKILDMVAPTT